MVKKETVVAWYTEDLSWVDVDDASVVVYIKNGVDIRGTFANLPWRFVSLPNVGREGHTYLHHIVENYDRLADLTVFLQGDPAPHMIPGVLGMVPKLRPEDVKWYLNLASSRMVKMQGVECPFWPEGARLTTALYDTLFESPVPKTVTFGAGAMFAVTRDAILPPAG